MCSTWPVAQLWKAVFQFCLKNSTFYFVMLGKWGLSRWSISTIFFYIFYCISISEIICSYLIAKLNVFFLCYSTNICLMFHQLHISTRTWKRSSKATFSERKTKDLSKKDPNLKLQDEAEAYDKITVQANINTHPGINFSTLILLLALFKVLITMVQIIAVSSV